MRSYGLIARSLTDAQRAHLVAIGAAATDTLNTSVLESLIDLRLIVESDGEWTLTQAGRLVVRSFGR
jgi:hypothetical protein